MHDNSRILRKQLHLNTSNINFYTFQVTVKKQIFLYSVLIFRLSFYKNAYVFKTEFMPVNNIIGDEKCKKFMFFFLFFQLLSKRNYILLTEIN